MAEPPIHYCTTTDNVCIAYTEIGEGVPVVFASNVWGDVQWYAQNEGTRRQMDVLSASGCRVIRYDMRGMGSSDRDALDLSVGARVLDLEAVIDATGLDRFALCGYTHGNAAAIAYAESHSARVSHLILVNPYATGQAYYTKVPAAHVMMGLRSMAQEEWEFFTLTLASALGQHIDPAQAQRVAAMFRDSTSSEVYMAYADEASKTDLTDLLPRIAVPTMVVLDTGGAGHPDLAKAVASRIPGARFVTSEAYVGELLAFIGLLERAPESPIRQFDAGAGGTAVILFADIVDSTALTERLGDASFRDRARALDDALRVAVRDCGGATIDGKLVGDGILATFPAASQAIDAALGCVRACDRTELQLHLGIHAGDVIRERDPSGQSNVYGGAVNIASRISGLSAPGEVLVSRTVRDLARTSAGVEFEDRGEHALKGIAEAVRVFAVRKAEANG